MSWHVMLDEYDLRIATWVGKSRTKYAQDRGWQPHNHPPGTNCEQWSIEGAAREYAAAKCLGLFWPHNIGILVDYDLAPDIQIRGTTNPIADLIIRKKDNDTDRFILVTNDRSLYTLRGWAFGSECKQEQWYKAPTNPKYWDYFVPNKMLRPMEEFVL